MKIPSKSSNTARSERMKEGTRLLCCEIVRLRKSRGLGQKDLADRIGQKTPAQLCKLEKGLHLPHAAFLEKIECGLNLPPQSLVSMRNQIVLDGCHDDNQCFDDPSIRFAPTCDNHTIDADSLKRLVEQIAPTADRYANALAMLKRSTFCRINLGTLKASTAQDGITYAEGLRDLVGDFTAPLPALLPQLERLNFRFIPVSTLPPCVREDGSLKRRNAFAFHDQRYDNPVIVVNEESTPHEQLYDIAYEIGSYLRYRRGLTLRCLRKKEEWQFCRAFATTLLVPTIVIKDLIDSLGIARSHWTMPLVDNLAYRFGVSSMAMLVRLMSINAITCQLYNDLTAQLRKPHACDNPRLFPPRPPLVFGAWLETLRLRAAIAR